MGPRTTTALLWVAAFLVTVGLAVFQRMTGPTYPMRGTVQLGEQMVRYQLLRTHAGEGGLPVRLRVPVDDGGGVVSWRRFPTAEAWQEQAMIRAGDELRAEIPHQPPAGKVEYRVVLENPHSRVSVPAAEAVVARFRGEVPSAVLIPHILAMFVSMLLATRSLLEVLRADRDGRTSILAAMALLIVGGLILGPVVQKHAFGAYWTGWPVGTDLTDNKTAVAFLAWLPAVVLALRRRRTRAAVVIGWVVMMAVFLIPHSLHGSQIEWSAENTPQ